MIYLLTRAALKHKHFSDEVLSYARSYLRSGDGFLVRIALGSWVSLADQVELEYLQGITLRDPELERYRQKVVELIDARLWREQKRWNE